MLINDVEKFSDCNSNIDTMIIRLVKVLENICLDWVVLSLDLSLSNHSPKNKDDKKKDDSSSDTKKIPFSNDFRWSLLKNRSVLISSSSSTEPYTVIFSSLPPWIFFTDSFGCQESPSMGMVGVRYVKFQVYNIF